MTVATEAGKAAELICFALQPKIARGADERYGALWSDYRTDENFRDIVDAVANGLGLVVIDATDQGLIVAPMDKSPFSFRLADYQRGLDSKRRMLIGLVHLVIAAVSYPKEARPRGRHRHTTLGRTDRAVSCVTPAPAWRKATTVTRRRAKKPMRGPPGGPSR